MTHPFADIAKLTPEEQDAYWRDLTVFGNAYIKRYPDGRVVRVPVEDMPVSVNSNEVRK